MNKELFSWVMSIGEIGKLIFAFLCWIVIVSWLPRMVRALETIARRRE